MKNDSHHGPNDGTTNAPKPFPVAAGFVHPALEDLWIFFCTGGGQLVLFCE